MESWLLVTELIMDKFQEREVAKGFWLYDWLIRKGVVIKSINYDYWYELEKSDGIGVSNELPDLNEMGEMYMIEWADSEYKNRKSFTVGTLGLNSTKITTDASVGQAIEWL